MALKSNHLEIAQLLIYYKADPWSVPNMDYYDLVKGNPEGKKILSRARKVYSSFMILILNSLI